MASGARLKGGNELRARIKSLGLVFKPLGRKWADSTAREMHSSVPERTGRLKRSFKRRNATQKKATVVGHYTAYFVDKGPKAHDITAKPGKKLIFEGPRGTVFARKVHHRGYRGRPFRKRSAEAGLRQNPMADEVIALWNRSA